MQSIQINMTIEFYDMASHTMLGCVTRCQSCPDVSIHLFFLLTFDLSVRIALKTQFRYRIETSQDF